MSETDITPITMISFGVGRLKIGWHFAWITAGLVIIAGCATPRTKEIQPEVTTNILPFIQDGITHRSEVLNRLGDPVSSYQDGEIITFRLIKDRAGKFQITKGGPINFAPDEFGSKIGLHCLVLVFDAENVLAQHSLVFVR